MAAAALVLVAPASCGTIGTWGNDLPEGSLAISLSDGLHEELADVPHGREYTVRFSLRNTESAPVRLTGIGVRASFGAAKFIDAKAVTRDSGDREARVFDGFPPEDGDDVSDWGDLTSTEVEANGAVDIYVGVTYTSGDQAGIEGFDVHYEIRGIDEVTAADIDISFCQGSMVDGDQCADRTEPMNENQRPATTSTTSRPTEDL
jgi:hypothetical protein